MFFRIFILILLSVFVEPVFSQDLDVDSLLSRIERIERNVSDLQKGKLNQIDKNLSAGYISRNESRLDEIETKNRKNFGSIEELSNKIKNLDEKLDLINSDFQSRLIKIEKRLEEFSKSQKKEVQINPKNQGFVNNSPELEEITANDQNQMSSKKQETELLNEADVKIKYENAIKLLWASNYDEAKKELMDLKKIGPVDLMPNIQYWLGEVFYAQKEFERAIVEFGEGLEKYPDSIKGPDNMLKLGLSFSNLGKKNDACNVLYELEVKYKSSSKNVLKRASSERKKLDCPKE